MTYIMQEHQNSPATLPGIRDEMLVGPYVADSWPGRRRVYILMTGDIRPKVDCPKRISHNSLDM